MLTSEVIMVKGGTMNLLIITLVGKNDTKNFRRSQGANANENGSLSDRPRCDRDLGFFRYPGETKSTFYSIKNDGEGF